MRKKPVLAIVPAGPLDQGSVLDRRSDLADRVRDYAGKAEAANTKRARKADWGVFEAWCSAQRATPLPATPETVAAFLVDQAHGAAGRDSKAVATVARYAQSISSAHKLRGLVSPTDHEAVKHVLRGIKRDKGTRQDHKEALTAELLMRGLPPESSAHDQDVRDRALLLFGLTSGMRREELCAIELRDLQHVPEGVVVNLRWSKTDQEGKGRQIAIPRLDGPFCPLRALKRWLATAGHTSGPVFRGLKRNGGIRSAPMSDRTVCDAVKRAAKRAGLDVSKFGAHSLRAGYVTTMREEGVDWGSIMEQTGHRRIETVKLYSRYTPEVHAATRVVAGFQGAFGRGRQSKKERP